MKKKTKANKENQSDSQDQEIQDSKIEEQHQALIATLCNQGEACYQILVKLQEIVEALKESNKINQERNSIISDEESEEEEEEEEGESEEEEPEDEED